MGERSLHVAYMLYCGGGLCTMAMVTRDMSCTLLHNVNSFRLAMYGNLRRGGGDYYRCVPYNASKQSVLAALSIEG